MHPLAQKLFDHIRRLDVLKPGDRVGVAVSGGADSVGLLRLLLELRHELGIVLSVVHFNHKLRGPESDEDERFVAETASGHQLEIYLSRGDVAAAAEANGLSIETAAREMRYEFFRQLQAGFEQAKTGLPDGSSNAPSSETLTSQLVPSESDPTSEHTLQNSAGDDPVCFSGQFHRPLKLRRLDAIATGHTLDDQAETVLMRVLRGTGTHGLGGIYPVVAFEDEPTKEAEEQSGKVIRPLLTVRHHELEAYLREIGQPWHEDSSNRNLHHTRNRIRHVLMPLLEREFNPAVKENLSELAAIARAEEDYWENEISGWIGTAIHWSEPDRAISPAPAGSLVQLQPPNLELQKRLPEPGSFVRNASIDLLWLLSELPAVQRRALKAVGDTARFPLKFQHVEQILRFAADENNRGEKLSLPLGWTVIREPEALTFLTPDLRTYERTPTDYEYSLPLPGRAIVLEAGVVVEAVRVSPNQKETKEEYRDCLLDASLVSNSLKVRNWRAGERFWPVHTKAPKKIKELLQEKHVRGPERPAWPVVVSGDEVVWVRGLLAATQFRAKNENADAVLIRAVPLQDEI